MCNIQHAINFILRSTLSNLPHYRINPAEHAELKRYVDKLLSKGFIKESLTLLAVPALLTPKKDDSWMMCIDSRAINKINVKYWFPIPRLDNKLDMMSEITIFWKIGLKIATIKFEFIQEMSGRLLLRLKTNYMSRWSCLLAWQMLPTLSCMW